MALVATVAWTPDASAASRLRNGRFWLICHLSHRAADDPIVWPGQPGVTHSHDFIGNATTNANSMYEGMLGGATNCAVPGDTAGYWVPTLLMDGSPIGIQWVNVYYWGF